MKKKYLALLFMGLLAGSVALQAGTFFLYIEETCNGERGLFLSGAREGILDTFFEYDQIIYDDMSDKGTSDRIETGDVGLPLSTARLGGADFLLAVTIHSTVEKNTLESKATEHVASNCAYYLYEVGTGRLLTHGSYSMEKSDLADKRERDKLGFELGRTISQHFTSYFTE